MDETGIQQKLAELHLNDPEHWLARAREARAMAENMSDAQAKETILSIAQGYEKMAQHARARLERLKPTRGA